MCSPLREGAPPEDAQSLQPLLDTGSLEVFPLPAAYTPLRFVAEYREVRRRVREFIDRSTHLQFAIGGLFGDWGAFATLWATRRGRKVAVWTDAVESSILQFKALSAPNPRRMMRRIYARLMKHFERYVIRRASIGLFHGMDTFGAYARFSRDPHLVHDIHLGPDARISPKQLLEKAARRPGPLQIIYAGRVHPEKGFHDWIEILSKVKAQGVEFFATWYGDGPALEEARHLAKDFDVKGQVQFPGAINDRSKLVGRLREGDIFLFCHKIEESPRCLIEALLSGTPIVGYRSSYASDLIKKNGGGKLTRIHDKNALAAAVVHLSEDREYLRDLFNRAALDGHPLTDVEVFRHRSQLIKRMENPTDTTDPA